MYIALIMFILFAFRANAIRKTKGYNLAFSLYVLFSLSFLSSAIMGLLLPRFCDNIDLSACLYLLVVFIIWFEAFNSNYYIDTKDPRNKLLAKIMITIMLPTFFYFFYHFWGVLTSGLLFVDDNVRTILRYNRVLPDTPLNTITGFIGCLYFVNIFLFYVGVVEKWGVKYNVPLFISSLAFPFYCLCFFGRDGIILWILNFLILFLLFKDRFVHKTKKKISQLILVFVSILAVIVIFITANRFFNEYSDRERNLVGTFGYLGQQLGNFSDVFYVDFQHSGTMFPGFSQMFDKMFYVHEASDKDILERLGYEDEVFVFKYYVYTLLSAYGYIGAIIVSLIFSIIILAISKTSQRSHSTLPFLFALIIYQIPMNGVFYFRQGVSRGDMGYAFGMMILLFVYLLNSKPRTSVLSSTRI